MRSKGIDDVLVQSIGIETMSDVIGHSKKDISELFNMLSLRELREKRIWDTLIRLTALGIALRSSLSNGLLATMFDIMYRPNVKLDLNAIISDAVADTSLNEDFISNNYWRVRKQFLDILEPFPSKTDVNNVLSVHISRGVRDSRSHDRSSHSVLSHVPCMSTPQHYVAVDTNPGQYVI
jgi:predicted RecB family nuclease